MQAFPEYEWLPYSLPARHFSWRIRGNPLSWYRDLRALEAVDLVIATSMVDLATLRGLVPKLASVPWLVYFHENQLAYPASDVAKKYLEPAMVNIYSALAAEHCVFNSEYNKRSFFSGAEALLRRFPDRVPTNVVAELESKSSVVPVPLADSLFERAHATATDTARLIWNHRWEYDKAPERLLGIVQRLPASLPLKVFVLGQRFHSLPPAMASLETLLTERGWLGHWGPVQPREQYLSLLAQGGIVLSTALHDFQGLSILEAVALGCEPLVPDRLAYPEFIPDDCRYHSVENHDETHIEQELQEAARHIERRLCEQPRPVDVQHLSWARQRLVYKQLIEQWL